MPVTLSSANVLIVQVSRRVQPDYGYAADIAIERAQAKLEAHGWTGTYTTTRQLKDRGNARAFAVTFTNLRRLA